MRQSFSDNFAGYGDTGMGSLYDLPPVARAAAPAAPITPGRLAPDALIPRPYQLEDIKFIKAAWVAGSRAVLYRAATGLGKATVLATLAAIHRADERTLVLIDNVKLAKQLRATFARQLGWQPGLIGGGITDGLDRRVVICVQQSLNSMRGDETRAEQLFDPTQFGLLLIDECEAALAERYVALVRFFLNGNPDLHALGCTATPIRGDGVGMGALFDHVVEEEGPLNRGPLWAFQNGWLVPPKQAFIQCKADFSTLKVRKAGGEADYSDEKIAELLATDERLIEMAQAIVQSAADDRCMVICPNDTDVADKIADYINGQKPRSAWAVHGKVTDPEAVMASHQRGDFQFLCGVNMLTKGYDDPKIKKVYILRPTKSQRLFQQIIGRAFRPDGSIARQLGELDDPAARRALIASSPKPKAIIYCLVGVDASARDMQIADLLRGRLTDEELERAKERLLDGAKQEDGTIAASPDAAGEDIAEAVKEVRRQMRDEREAANRRRIEVERAELQITELADGEEFGRPVKEWTGPYHLLKSLGFKDHELKAMPFDVAQRESRRWNARRYCKPPRCTHGQWKVLERRGHAATDLEAMTAKDAKGLIDEISKRERWTKKAS